MFRLPQRRLPAWAQEVEEARAAYDALAPLSAERLGELAGWLLLEQVTHEMRLDGYRLERERLRELLLEGKMAETPEEQLALGFAAAIRRLSAHVATGLEEGRPVELTLELLLDLARLSLGRAEGAKELLRHRRVNPLYPEHDPCSPEELPHLLRLALEWFTAESFAELNPIEQAALVHVRLFDLQPFERASQRVARLAANLYTLRAGLPPILIPVEATAAYYEALLSGLRMATEPLVELFARLVAGTLRTLRQLALESA
ncbi:MAG: Fic family protein [Blastocatellia bacterium]|nr:Fic family protein [Blastocatellia bacterium]MCS7157606.1 Fic family protein [Blastocatellia bacterium]MCX7751871.1 Fic family protein [Blastocatellia bacterium]MDW8166977.1 Fic family protein [Acidobacteriota bacterium]MDW8257081.1 Fic family protein [Acidobacteriota bacterium]